MNTGRTSLLCSALAVVASVLTCSTAQAGTVTVGSPMTWSFFPTPVGTAGELGNNSQLGEAGAQVTSPVDGAVIGWTMLGEGVSFRLRVLRAEAAGTYLAGAASAPQAIGTFGVSTFTTDLPIETGEIVGLEAGSATDRIGTATGSAPGSLAETWDAAPESTATRPEGGAPNSEFAFSATVLLAPTIASVTPASGPVARGTTVAISGTDFADVEGVSFGSVAATGYSVDSEGLVTALAPAGTGAGVVPVSVTTEAGTATSSQSFTYSAPAPPAAPAAEPPLNCVVPKLKGKKLKGAKKKIKAADCKLGKITKKDTGGRSAKVVKQRPTAGTTRAPGSKVNVVLGGK